MKIEKILIYLTYHITKILTLKNCKYNFVINRFMAQIKHLFYVIIKYYVDVNAEILFSIRKLYTYIRTNKYNFIFCNTHSNYFHQWAKDLQNKKKKIIKETQDLYNKMYKTIFLLLLLIIKILTMYHILRVTLKYCVIIYDNNYFYFILVHLSRNGENGNTKN